ncbi:MAG: multidrug effflux MFS transporter [Kutzneria sp.]|nr:multidrug effflux MFS transporter [Kutzneria sp.]
MSRLRTVRFVLILGTLSSFAPLSIDMYLPAFPAMADELRASPSDIQLTLTAVSTGLALGQLIAGPLSDALGRRRPLLVGLAAFTVVSLLCAAAPSVAILAVLRLVQGLAGAVGIVIARAVVRDLYSGAALARFFSLSLLVNSVALIVGPLLGGQLLRWASWRGVFVVLSTIGLLSLIVTVLGLPETLPRANRRAGSVSASLRTLWSLLRDRLFVGYASSLALAFAALFAYISGASFVLQDRYGLSPQGFSIVFGTSSLAIMAVSQLNTWLIGRIGPRRLLAVGLTTTVCGCLGVLAALTTGVGLLGVLPALFLVAGSNGLVFPNSTALALADHPETAGNASALLGMFQFAASGVIAPLVGGGGANAATSMGLVMFLPAAAALSVFLLLTRDSAVKSIRAE